MRGIRCGTMLRRSFARNHFSGPFSPTKRKLLFWGYKESDLHRLARQRPWWENAAIFCGLLIFVNVSSAAFYVGNRWYQSWRPTGNEIHVREVIDEKLFTRPDLAVVAVRMLMHHALSDTQTPFGCPVVAPELYHDEAQELFDFLWNLHADQPMYSIPDLWAMVTAKALARLGGPHVVPFRGRENPPEFMTRKDLLVFPPALITEDRRDVLNMKRILSRQGFSLERLVALIGCARCIGFHDAANFHTKEVVIPTMRRHPGTLGPREDEFHLPDTISKCTLDPYVFGSEYFDLLLDYKWKQSGFFKRNRTSEYRCTDRDRTREVTLLDPFSEKSIEVERRRIQASAKAIDAIESIEKRDNKSFNQNDSDTDGKFGRTGEAQFIPGMEPKAQVAHTKTDDPLDADYEIERTTISVNPCSQVSMRGMDMMLLDDALTKGWLYQFADDELEFYSTVGDVVLDIQQRGHNRNNLYVWK